MSKVLIIEARFYEKIADGLFVSAKTELDNAGISFDKIEVPGCFEIPAAMAMAIDSGKYDGYVALGCVIRGETTHYDYVCEQSAFGINKLAMKHSLPVGFGIITAENRQQAEARADRERKDMGGKAARAVIAMLKIKEKFAS